MRRLKLFLATLAGSATATHADAACQAKLDAVILAGTTSGSVRVVESQAALTGTASGRALYTYEFASRSLARKIWPRIGAEPPTEGIYSDTKTYQRQSGSPAWTSTDHSPAQEVRTREAFLGFADPSKFIAAVRESSRITFEYAPSGKPGETEAPRKGAVEIDASGRPAVLSYAAAFGVPAKSIFTFAYDPARRIEPPR